MENTVRIILIILLLFTGIVIGTISVNMWAAVLGNTSLKTWLILLASITIFIISYCLYCKYFE